MPQLTDAERQFVRNETIVSIVLNALVSAVFVWLLFRGKSEVGLWGMDGLAFDLLPTTFMITFMMTLGLSLVIRRRVGRGSAPRLGWVRAEHPWLRFLPAWLLPRALLLAAGMMVLFVPATVGLLIAAGWHPMAIGHVYLFKVIYGALMGLVATPVILLAALADRAGAPATQPIL